MPSLPIEPTEPDGAPEVAEKRPIGSLARVHFVAVGGTGMGSLAGLLKARNLEITGSDKALYPPMSTALADWGIAVSEGFDPGNLESGAYGIDLLPDLVVIGNAVRPDNAEARAAIASDIPYRSFSDALFELAMADKHRIVVSGTHGKTTTTSVVAYLLQATGREPSLLVGGISLDFGGSFIEGSGRDFVVEGDEYDTAFFDKTPKFLHYHPNSLILTSVEFDHADIYRDLDHVKSAFRDLVSAMPEDGCIVADWRHEHVRDVLGTASCSVVRYWVDDPEVAEFEAAGDSQQARLREEADWIADRLEPGTDGTRFRLAGPGTGTRSVFMPLYGGFNVANCVAALATLYDRDVSLDESIPALANFKGVKRRQEIRGEARGVVIIDDFAHHPTAVKASIGALRARFPGRRLVVIFEARTNTSRRAIFQDAYARAFDAAARVLIRDLPDEPIYSNTGEPSELFSAEALVSSLAARGLDAEVFEDIDAIAETEARSLRSGDVVLVMSNGDFGNIWEKLLAALRKD